MNQVGESVNLVVADEDYVEGLDLEGQENETEDGGGLDVVEQSSFVELAGEAHFPHEV